MKCLKLTANECGNNASPAVVKALESLSGGKDSKIVFEKGTYHFYTDGTVKRFYAVSNNVSSDKDVVFSIRNFDGLTIDGGGSTFVFHNIVFPFAISKSRNVHLENFCVDRGQTPQAVMRVKEVNENGFSLEIDRGKCPFRVENGNLIFEREWGELSSHDRILGLQSSSTKAVQYLVVGDCDKPTANLATTHVCADATETPDGVSFVFRPENKFPFRFDAGETLLSIVDGGRLSDLIFIERSENVKIRNITVKRALGMGGIAQISKNIEIDNFSTAPRSENDPCTLITADALHFVNCYGKLEVKNCKISDIGDDVINVHGMYTKVSTCDKENIYADIAHSEQRYFIPYEHGDRLEIIDDKTLEIVAEFKVGNASVISDDGSKVKIEGHFSKGFAENIKKDFLIEIPDKMPDVHIYDNSFSDFPNMRISGVGKIVIENNMICKSNTALIAQDLAKYWYESGRIKNLTFRNNTIDNSRSESFIMVGASGFEPDNCPKIHDRIEICGNTFKGVKKYAINISGTKNYTIHDNKFEGKKEILIDGKVTEQGL